MTQKRRPNPAEIARSIKSVRELLKWSQENLAAEANVTPRTIQRLEGAEEVSDETLRRVAQAVHIDQDFFTREHEFRPAEDLSADLEKIKRENWMLQAEHVVSGQRLAEFLAGLSAWQYSHDDGLAVESMKTFLDYINELVQYSAFDEMSPSDKIETGQLFADQLQALTVDGLRVYVASHRLKLRTAGGGDGAPMTLGYVRVTRNALETFLIPKTTQFRFG